jgi:hypothetical protein
VTVLERHPKFQRTSPIPSSGESRENTPLMTEAKNISKTLDFCPELSSVNKKSSSYKL